MVHDQNQIQGLTVTSLKLAWFHENFALIHAATLRWVQENNFQLKIDGKELVLDQLMTEFIVNSWIPKVLEIIIKALQNKIHALSHNEMKTDVPLFSKTMSHQLYSVQHTSRTYLES